MRPGSQVITLTLPTKNRAIFINGELVDCSGNSSPGAVLTGAAMLAIKLEIANSIKVTISSAVGPIKSHRASFVRPVMRFFGAGVGVGARGGFGVGFGLWFGAGLKFCCCGSMR